MFFVSKKLTATLVSIACISGFVFATGTNIANNDTDNPIDAEAQTNFYLVGEKMNGWNLTNRDYPLNLVSGTTYRWTGVLALNEEFKINTNDTWSGVKGWSNHADSGCRNDGTFAYGDGGNIRVAESYKFEINYNSSDSQITSNVFHVQASTNGINANRMRIWLDRGVYEADDALVCIQYGATINNQSDIISPSGWEVRSDDYWYAYFDIPILSAGQQFRVVRLSDKKGKVWTWSSTFSWVAGANSKVFYVGNDWSTLTNGIISDDVTTNAEWFLPKVLEGYLTCSSSSVNGYGAFNQMKLTFFTKADGTTSKITPGITLGSRTCWDYSGVGTSGYSSDKGTGVQVNALVKYNKMATLSSVAPGSISSPPLIGGVNLNVSLPTLLLISAISLSSIVVFIFIRKRLLPV
jgi:hypothetical protein